MRWSLLVGNFWGTEIRLHLTLLLIIPYVLITFRPQNFFDAVRLLAIIAAVFLCVGLHEVGHTLAARQFGIRVNSIVLWPLGGFANLSRRPEKVLPDLVISAAGPVTNLVIAAGLLALIPIERLIVTTNYFPQAARLLWEIDLFPFLAGLTVSNLALALFNLIPIYPLDGGQIARGLLKLMFGEKNADWIMLIFSLPLALAFTLYGLYVRDLIVILTGLLLVLAAVTLSPQLYNQLTIFFLYFIDRASFYQRKGDFDGAVRELNRTIEQHPNKPGMYISRAIVRLNTSEPRLARLDIDNALKLDPNNPITWTLLGELLGLDKQTQPAFDAFNKAIRIRPNFALAYLDRGRLHQEQGSLDLALADMNHAAELGQDYAVVYLMRSILNFQMDRIAASRTDADKALRFAPRWMLCFSELFLVDLQGHLKWALDYYWTAIQRMPTAYQAFQGRADACRVNNRLEWAIADYNRAVKLAPTQAEIYLARGRCYHQLGHAAWASEDYCRAVEMAKQSHIRRQAENLLQQITPREPGEPVLPTGEPGGSLVKPLENAPGQQ